MADPKPSLSGLVNAANLVGGLPPLFANAIDPEALRKVWVIPPEVAHEGNVTRYDLGLLFDESIALSVPGFDAISLLVGPAGDDSTLFEFEVQVLPSILLTVKDVAFALRLKNSYFKPAVLNPSTNAYEVDPSKPFLDIGLGNVSFSFDLDGGIQISTNAGITLPPTLIGDSGVAIQATDVQLFLSPDSAPPGRPAGTKGVLIPSAQVFLPGSLSQGVTLSMTNAFIGNGGFSGTVSTTVPGAEQDIGGVKVTLTQVSLSFAQNALLDFTLTGTVLLPYFDKQLLVALTVGLDGKLALVVTGVAPGDGSYDASTGILTLTEGPLRFDLKRLELDFADGAITFHGSGSITPTFAGISFPTFEIEDFSIDSHGNLHLAGGWLDLPNHLSLSLYGFTLEITKIGFGTTDDVPSRRWVGFSGGLTLVDGLSAGASVDGLRLLWDKDGTPSIAMDGVGIAVDIPDVLTIRGAVSLKDQEFRGGVEINLKAAQLELGGQFVAGTLSSGQKYFAVFVHADLPVGLPLLATGLGIYGVAGLYAQRMVPDRQDGEGWYFNPDGSDGWYLRQVPGSVAQGVEDLGKWRGAAEGLGFGAGITLGTLGDNGFSFNGRLLLVLSFPGPVIFIEGRANLFKKRAALSDDALFRALVVFDPKSSFLISMDAKYDYRSSGELIDIAGSAEAFFDLADPSKWHIWLGQKDNRARRIRARAFQLFEVDGYFMLDGSELQLGASWSFNKSYGFKHLSVDVGASLEGGAVVSWHPAHLAGSLAFEGHVKLRAFGIGLGLSVGASISAEVFEPFHLKGDFHVGIDLPWPLPDVGASITLQWGGALSAPPPLPLPLGEAAAEFADRGLRWPFVRGTNLLPDNDQGGSEFASSATPGDPETSGYDFEHALRVPVDAAFALTFSRPADDSSRIGNNPNRKGVAEETIGDPVTPAGRGYTVKYSLLSAEIDKLAPIGPSETAGSPIPSGQVGTGWVPVAETGVSALASANLPAVFGSWALAGPPQMTPEAQKSSDTTFAQTKLILNAKSPFEATAIASQVWEDWFTSAYPGYPCSPPGNSPNFVDVFQQPIGTEFFTGEFQFTDPAFDVQWQYGGDITSNEEIVQGVLGAIGRGLRIIPEPLPSGIASGSPVKIIPPAGVTQVNIRVGTPATFIPLFQQGSFIAGNNPRAILDGTVLLDSFKVVGGQRVKTGVPDPRIINLGADQGLVVDFSMSFRPQRSAMEIEFVLFGVDDEGPTPLATVELFDSAGAALLGTPRQVVGAGKQSVRLKVNDIAEIVMTAVAASFLVEHIEIRTPVRALAHTAAGTTGIFAEQDGLLQIDAQGAAIDTIWFSDECGGQFLLLEIAIPSRTDEVIQHTISSLAQFAEEGPVLEPDTHYRVTVQTRRVATPISSDADAVDATTAFKEQLYFRTAALPGIGVPDAPTGTRNGIDDPNKPPTTGFEDLGFYTKSTVPAILEPAGGHQTPARAIYRAYDANVEFSENTPYVELMYRRGRRDLSLRLFDANNRPLAGADGRAIVASSTWRPSENPAISQAAAKWIGMVMAVTCAPTPDFDPASVLGNRTLTAPAEEAVLEPLTLYQARLVPMLLLEAFIDARSPLIANGQGFQLDRWRAEQSSADASAWQTQSETTTPSGAPGPVTTWFVTENSHVETTLVYDGTLASLGDTQHQDQPVNWLDLRASVQIRWQSGVVGFELRRTSGSQLLRLALDRSTGARQLLLVSGGQTKVLSEDTVSFPGADTDVIVTLECVGDRVQVFQRIVGEAETRIFDVSAVPSFAGTVALFSSGAVGTRFTQIAVHDLRSDPSTAFRFDFITSRYTNFNHQLQAFDDQLFPVPDGGGIGADQLSAAQANAGSVPGSPANDSGLGAVGDAESRAYDALELAALRAGKLIAPERIELTRARADNPGGVLLLRGPEPILWERASLVVEATPTVLELGVPGLIKLTGVSFGAVPEQESVHLLLREPAAMALHRLDWRALSSAGAPAPEWTEYFTFAVDDSIGDGVDIAVFSSAEDSNPPRPVGSVQRFVAGGTIVSAVHFPAEGVELRLVAPDGSVVHQRQFLPDTAYAPLDVSAIRKRDGTGIFLFGSALPTFGQTLRLRFTFRRDAGSSLPVLSQAGSTEREVTQLDVALD